MGRGGELLLAAGMGRPKKREKKRALHKLKRKNAPALRVKVLVCIEQAPQMHATYEKGFTVRHPGVKSAQRGSVQPRDALAVGEGRGVAHESRDRAKALHGGRGVVA